MPFITTTDGIELFYKDWGPKEATPLVFHHGWPLTADDWDAQMLFFLHQGFRVVAHDRRGHGRSSQSWTGNDMDTYADDVAQLTAALDLKGAIHIGHSTGGGEVARYLGRHGTGRVAKAVLIGAVPPHHGEDGGLSERPAGLGLRRHPRRRGRQPRAVLPGPHPALLRLQPAGRRGLAGGAATIGGARA